MKIYTKTGDLGTTSLLGGTRVDKYENQIEAYGSVDELNAHLAYWMDLLNLNDADKWRNITSFIDQIQRELFTIGSHLANDGTKSGIKLPEINLDLITQMEQNMDKMNEVVPAMTHFVLPGGHTLISYAHICRTVCRRAERRVVAIQELPHLDKIIMFLNRLSDWIFVTSRYLNHQLHLPENLWIWK
jgi:cob(I)alamin adenosyltransferase